LKRWLGLSVLVLAGGAFAADDAALRVVEACRARLDPATDLGIERIQKRCPELLPALASAPWRDLLPQTLRERRDEISAESLRALAELVRKAGTAAKLRDAPSREKLEPVLAGLGAKGQEGATRWDRFKRWLKEKLENRKDDDETSALEKWSRQFQTSEGIAQAITYAGYVMVGVLMLFVIWSELRAAGLLGRTRRGRGAGGPAAQWRRRLMLSDIAAAPLADRPGMLLRLLGEALTRAERLPAADGLTAATIVRRATLDSEQERAALAQIATTADTVRYGSNPPPEEQLEGTVNSAKALLERFARLAAGKH
jgi:hypothetical protein